MKITFALSLMFLSVSSFAGGLGFNCTNPLKQGCNFCAEDVEGQFIDIKNNYREYEGATNKSWFFNWKDKFPPYNLSAQVLDAKEHIKAHVQGFVRTNHPLYTFAGSHSTNKEDTGVIFILDQVSGRKSGNKRLRAMHSTTHAHPSGLAAIGKFVVFADKENVKLLDLDETMIKQDYSFNPSDIGAVGGGGIGMVKLATGEHLLISSGPGGRENPKKDRKTQFWKVASKDLKPPYSVQYLGESTYSQSTKWKGDYKYSENLSVITECGSGRIFTIHTSGDENIFKSKGYWRLSEVLNQNGVYKLRTLNTASMDQNVLRCHLRSAGTIWTGDDNVMRFICHERQVFDDFMGDKASMTFQVQIPSP